MLCHIGNVTTNATTTPITTIKVPTTIDANESPFKLAAVNNYTNNNNSLCDKNGFSVELPKPILSLANRKQTTTANTMNEVATSKSTSTAAEKRQQRAYSSNRPTLMDVALQASAREGLDAMTELYGKIVPDIIRNGMRLCN